MNCANKMLLLCVSDPCLITQTCFGCPTIFEFDEDVGEKNHYYFRLRHGTWRLENETNGAIIADGEAPCGIDGICNIDDMLKMLNSEMVFLLYQM